MAEPWELDWGVGPQQPEVPPGTPPDPLSPRHRQMLRPREPRQGVDLSVPATDEERAARMARRFGRGRDEGRMTAVTEMAGERIAQLPRAVAEDAWTLAATPSRMVNAAMEDPYGRSLHETAATGTGLAGLTMLGGRGGKLPEPGVYSGVRQASAKVGPDAEAVYQKLKAIASSSGYQLKEGGTGAFHINKGDEWVGTVSPPKLEGDKFFYYGANSKNSGHVSSLQEGIEALTTKKGVPPPPSKGWTQPNTAETISPEFQKIASDLENVSKEPFDPAQAQHVYPDEIKDPFEQVPYDPYDPPRGGAPLTHHELNKQFLPTGHELEPFKSNPGHYYYMAEGKTVGSIMPSSTDPGKFFYSGPKDSGWANSLSDAAQKLSEFVEPVVPKAPKKVKAPTGTAPPFDLSNFPSGAYSKEYSWGHDVYSKDSDWLGSVVDAPGGYKFTPIYGGNTQIFPTIQEAVNAGAKTVEGHLKDKQSKVDAFMAHEQRDIVPPETARHRTEVSAAMSHTPLDFIQEGKRVTGGYTTPAYWGTPKGELREPSRRVWLAGDQPLARLYAEKHYGGKVENVWLDTRNFLEIDTKGKVGPESFVHEIEKAKKDGKDGVTLYNNRDSPSLDPNVDPSTTHIVFDPRRIKSERAKEFDPESGNPLYSKLVDPRGVYGLIAGSDFKLYHASPHSFEKFDPKRIGSGEGSAMWTPGTYAAESPGVSGRGGYYDTLFTAQNMGRLPKGAIHPGASKLALTPLEKNVLQALGTGKTDLNTIFKGLVSSGIDRRAAAKVIENVNAHKSNIYELSVKGRPEDFPTLHEPREAPVPQVPGVKYLDARSRRTGEGTHNYVIYPEGLERVSITDKYAQLGGKTPPVAGGQQEPWQMDWGKTQEQEPWERYAAPSEGPQGPMPTTLPQKVQAAAEAASARTHQQNRSQLNAVGRFLDETGKKAHDLLTGEVPPDPENVLEAAAMGTPMGAGRRVASQAARTLLQRQQDVTGVYLPRATEPANRFRSELLSGAPFVGAPLHKAKAATEAGIVKAGETAAAEAAYPAGIKAAMGEDASKISKAMMQMAISGDPQTLQVLGRLRGSVHPSAWNNLQSHFIQDLGGGAKFDPATFRLNYGGMSPQARSIIFGTTKDPLRFQLDAIEAVSRRAASWQPRQSFGGRLGKTAAIGYTMVDPIGALSTFITGRSMAKYLAKPSTAAPIAQWSMAYERFMRSGGAPAAVASFRIAIDNLRNSLGEDFSDEDMMKAIGVK